MLVSHIHYKSNVWNTNRVNTTIHGYEHVRLVAADNIKSYDTEAADVFPGRNNVTSFTDYTQPSSYWNNNTSVSRPVLNIRQSGDLILFDYIQGTGIADKIGRAHV